LDIRKASRNNKSGVENIDADDLYAIMQSHRLQKTMDPKTLEYLTGLGPVIDRVATKANEEELNAFAMAGIAQDVGIATLSKEILLRFGTSDRSKEPSPWENLKDKWRS
jgi:hypothetical protein